MKKIYWLFILFNFLINSTVYADKLGTISNNLAYLVTVQKAIQGIQANILAAELNMQAIMKQIDANMTGHAGWGNYQFQDQQSYGNSAKDWNSLMHMAETAQGDGQLGIIVNGLSKEFLANQSRFNQGIANSNIQKYYALKSQTTLAARAASQLDYNKIQTQITYQQMLQGQIEKTDNLKAAVDLNNRIHVENNLIQLEILRQVALANQQQAVTEQATVNTALANAKFLTKVESQQ